MAFVWIRGAQVRCAEKSPFTLSSLGGLDLVSHAMLRHVKGHATPNRPRRRLNRMGPFGSAMRPGTYRAKAITRDGMTGWCRRGAIASLGERHEVWTRKRRRANRRHQQEIFHDVDKYYKCAPNGPRRADAPIQVVDLTCVSLFAPGWRTFCF